MIDMKTLTHDEFMAYGDRVGRSDPAWNKERQRRMRNSKQKYYRSVAKGEQK